MSKKNEAVKNEAVKNEAVKNEKQTFESLIGNKFVTKILNGNHEKDSNFAELISDWKKYKEEMDSAINKAQSEMKEIEDIQRMAENHISQLRRQIEIHQAQANLQRGSALAIEKILTPKEVKNGTNN